MARQVPFQVSANARREVRTSLAAKLEALQETALSDFMAVRNRLHLNHGRKWTQPTIETGIDGDLKVISAEVSISFERIADADLSMIEESVSSMFEQLQAAQQTAMYQLIGETCDKTGNVIRAAPEDFPEAFCLMLEKLNFSVSEEGQVELPRLHTHSDAAHLIHALESKSQEFGGRVKEIIERKSAEALEAEAIRKSRFRRHQRP